MASSWLHHHWGWVVTGATCIAFFFGYGFILSFSVLFVTFQREFNSSATATAWVGSLPNGLTGMVAPLVNILIERIGNRAVVVIGVSTISVGLITTSFMSSIAPMYFTYSVLFGVGTGCIMMGSFSLILQYFPGKNSTGGIVLPMASSNLGMLSLGPLTFYLEKRFGWRNTLRICAGMIIGIALPAVAWAHREPRRSSTSGAENDVVKESVIILQGNMIEKTKTYRLIDGKDRQVSIESESVESTSEECDERIDSVKMRTSEYEKQQGGVKDLDNRDHSGQLLLCKDSFQTFPDTISKSDGKQSLEDGNVSISSPQTDIYEQSAEGASFTMARRMLIALTFPDVWCLALASFGYGLTNSFFFIQLVSYLMSLDFTEANGAQAVVALGVSMMTGKVVLSLVSDYLPFHQLYLSTLASGLGIVIMICLLQAPSLIVVMCLLVVLGAVVFSIADTLPYCNHNLVFGVEKGREISPILAFLNGLGLLIASFLGESLDQTGSYDIALFICIGTYALCGLLCIMVPVYQKCMVKDRFVMKSWRGWHWKKRKAVTPNS